VFLGNAGAFIGTNVFLKREEPRFRTGFGTGMGLCLMGLMAACVFYGGLWLGNRRRDAQRDEVGEHGDGERVGDVGEKAAGFRYSL
jgi:hypothetical protein